MLHDDFEIFIILYTIFYTDIAIEIQSYKSFILLKTFDDCARKVY